MKMIMGTTKVGFELTLPLYITTGKLKKQTHWLNMNKVFNMHHQVRNQVKKIFTEACLLMLLGKPKMKRCRITYTIYKPTRRRYDVMNVASVVDKFFQDALVESGVLEDDNYVIVPEVVGRHGGIDKNNPRVEVLVEELKE